MIDEAALHRAIAAAGVEAPSLIALRERLVEIVTGVVPADGALLHALSPRVPLDTAAVRGLSREALAASARAWDAVAVALAPLRDRANEQAGVARDTDAFPRGSPSRARYDDAIARHTGMASALVAHLIVRSRVRSALVSRRATAATRPSAPPSASGCARWRRRWPSPTRCT